MRTNGAMLVACATVLAGWASCAFTQEGAKIYGAKCASCHGKDGKGNPSMAKMFKVDLPALSLTDAATAARKDSELIATISKGKDKMPKFGGKLQEAEIGDVVAYVRSLGGSSETPAPVAGGAKPAAGFGDAAKLFGSKCASCHGKDGKGNPSMAKMFKVDPSALNLLDPGTLDKKDKELALATSKGKGKMPAYEGKLKQEEIGSIISYLRSLK